MRTCVWVSAWLRVWVCVHAWVWVCVFQEKDESSEKEGVGPEEKMYSLIATHATSGSFQLSFLIECHLISGDTRSKISTSKILMLK